MKSTELFLDESLIATFGKPKEKKKSASLNENADNPLIKALTEMDKAAEMFENLGMPKVATKIGKIMKKVSDKASGKKPLKAKKASKWMYLQDGTRVPNDYEEGKLKEVEPLKGNKIPLNEINVYAGFEADKNNMEKTTGGLAGCL